MNKVFKIVFNCLLVFVIVLLVTYITLRFANKIEIYNVETGSMEDKIHVGDYILLYKKSNYKVGDVVTYRVKDYFITHRIVKVENDKIITKGDANNAEDDGISSDRIVGKAVYWGGLLNMIINYKYVIVALLIALYLLSCYFGNDKLEDKKETKKKAIVRNNKNILEYEKEDFIPIVDNGEKNIESEFDDIKIDNDINIELDKQESKILNENLENEPIHLEDNVMIEEKTKKKKTKTTSKSTNTKTKKESATKTTKKKSTTKTETKEKTKKATSAKTKSVSTKAKSTSTKKKASSKK